MKLFCFVLCLPLAVFSQAQKTSVFEAMHFDSSYSIVSIGSSFLHSGDDLKKYNFFVDNLGELNKMKKAWTKKNRVDRLQAKDDSINLFVVKNKELVDPKFVIYPKQSIIHSGGNWYRFDMKNLTGTKEANPLIYHSETFRFPTYLAYSHFKDSMKKMPAVLFLSEPAKAFEGQFYLTKRRTADPDSPAFGLDNVNKELKNLAQGGKFLASHSGSDDFVLHNIKQVKIKVEGSRLLFDAYHNDNIEKSDWMPATFDTNIIFKD